MLDQRIDSFPNPSPGIRIADLPNIISGGWNGFRLTLQTGVPVSSAGQSSKSTLFFTPYLDQTIYVLNGGGQLTLINSNQISIGTSGLSASTVYYVYVFINSNNLLKLELSTTAPAQDSVTAIWVKSTDLTRRYVGVIGTDGSTLFNDTTNNRGVCNFQNKLPRHMFSSDPIISGTRTSTSATYAQIDSVACTFTTDGFVPVQFMLMCAYLENTVANDGVNLAIGSATNTVLATNSMNSQTSDSTLTTFQWPGVAFSNEHLAAGIYTRYAIFAIQTGGTATVLGTFLSGWIMS